jgi:sulfatase modifying factor 1
MKRLIVLVFFSFVSAAATAADKPSVPSKNPSETVGRGFEGVKAGDKKDLVSGIPFIWCPAGTFTMGTPGATDDESPVSVTLTSGFWLGETELTQGQWEKLMGTRTWSGEKNVKVGDDYAASYISHDDAVSYCQKLTAQERNADRLPNGWKYSLPTEAQWEYACRAGSQTKFSFGESEGQMGEYAWFIENVLHVDQRFAHQVGLKKPNAWGLRDMHGNVREWCSDWYDSKLRGGRDPVGPSNGSNRVARGGSWSSFPAYCRSANRSFDEPDYRFNYLGFRLAAVPE